MCVRVQGLDHYSGGGMGLVENREEVGVCRKHEKQARMAFHREKAGSLAYGLLQRAGVGAQLDSYWKNFKQF